MPKKNIVWILGQSGSGYAAAQPLLATKDIDLFIFSREEIGSLTPQSLNFSVERFGSPSLLIVSDSYFQEKSLVLAVLGFEPDIWNESEVKAKESNELIPLLGSYFAKNVLQTKIELSKTNQIIEINGTKIKLTAREFEILDQLMLAPKHTVARADFFNSVWSGLTVCNKVLDVHVSNLRKKVQAHGLKIRFVRPGSFEMVLPENYGEKHSKALPEAI